MGYPLVRKPAMLLAAKSRRASHEQYVESVRLEVVETARAMLDGQLSYLLGARKLDALRHEASVNDDDADFMVFVAVASDTDDYPLGSVER